MSNLYLAVDIAEAVERVVAAHQPLDVSATASKLLQAHPEAQATRTEVESTLVEELEVRRPFGSD